MTAPPGRRAGPLANDLDRASRTRRAGELVIRSNECDRHGLGKSNVRGVVRGEVRAKRPASFKQQNVRYSVDAQRAEICDRQLRSSFVDETGAMHASPCCDDLDVDQVRRGETLTSQPIPDPIAVVSIVSERRHDDAGIDDDQ